MSTSWIDYGTSDPRKIAQQTRSYVTDTGQGLIDENKAQASDAGWNAFQTQSRLNDWLSPLAAGQGGYNAGEVSQIRMTPQELAQLRLSPEEAAQYRMTPEQQQRLVTGAGISAGVGTAAAVGSAERAAAATGGNPLALAAYRVRAARQQASEAGDAMTKARIAASDAAAQRNLTVSNTAAQRNLTASDAAAQRAQQVGQARIGQQNTGVNYYTGLQAQSNAAKEAALGRVQQTYGTQTGGAAQAANLGVGASQTPSTFDKIIGGASGFLGALEDGDMVPGSKAAVVGENGPEKVVEMSGGPIEYNEDGMMYGDPETDPVLKTLDTMNLNSSLPPAPPQNWYQRFAAKMKQPSAMPGSPQRSAPQPWTPMDRYRDIGKAAGTVAHFLEDGDAMPSLQSGMTQGANGIFTSPTRVNLEPGEAVVPLTYRARAKVRPSAAALPPARTRQMYGGMYAAS